MTELRNPYPKEAMSIRTKLDKKTTDRGLEVYLYKVSAGWEAAGSGIRIVGDSFAVNFFIDNATHGQRFKTLAEAKEYFDSRK